MPLTEIANIHAATLHDALQRAVRIAPTKGAAWDRAQGIHLTFLPGDDELGGSVEVRATNTEVTYWHEIPARVGITALGFEKMACRLPASPLAPFVAGLPMNEDEHRVRFLVDIENAKECVVQFMRSKIKAKMMIIAGAYPEFGYIDCPMGGAQELASRLEQVGWACGDHGKLAGLYLDGKYMIGAEDKHAARAECLVETDHPVVAPLSSLAGLIKLGTDIRMGVLNDRLIISLDEASQITTSLILEPYPDIAGIMSKFVLSDKMTVPRLRTIAAMERLLLFSKSDRMPRCKIEIEGAEMYATLETDGSKAQDVVEVTDQVSTGKRTFVFNPLIIRTGLESFTTTHIEIRYSPGEKVLPWHMVDPSGGYECWLMPMADNAIEE